MLLKIVGFRLGVLKYVVCLCKRCDGSCVSGCNVRCGSVGDRIWKV